MRVWSLIAILFFLTACVQSGGTLGNGQIDPAEQELLDQAVSIVQGFMEEKQKQQADDTLVPDDTSLDIVGSGADGDSVIDQNDIEQKTDLIKETIIIHGRYNGDRPTFYGSKNLGQYPMSFWFTAPGCLTRTKITTNHKRLEYGGYAGWIFKQSDVAYRGMGIVGPQACQGTTVILEY